MQNLQKQLKLIATQQEKIISENQNKTTKQKETIASTSKSNTSEVQSNLGGVKPTA